MGRTATTGYITRELLDHKLAAQNWCCLICGVRFVEGEQCMWMEDGIAHVACLNATASRPTGSED